MHIPQRPKTPIILRLIITYTREYEKKMDNAFIVTTNNQEYHALTPNTLASSEKPWEVTKKIIIMYCIISNMYCILSKCQTF